MNLPNKFKKTPKPKKSQINPNKSKEIPIDSILFSREKKTKTKHGKAAWEWENPKYIALKIGKFGKIPNIALKKWENWENPKFLAGLGFLGKGNPGRRKKIPEKKKSKTFQEKSINIHK